MTFKGAVVGCEPTAAGPKGLARWRKESASTIISRLTERMRLCAPTLRFQRPSDRCTFTLRVTKNCQMRAALQLKVVGDELLNLGRLVSWT